MVHILCDHSAAFSTTDATDLASDRALMIYYYISVTHPFMGFICVEFPYDRLIGEEKSFEGILRPVTQCPHCHIAVGRGKGSPKESPWLLLSLTVISGGGCWFGDCGPPNQWQSANQWQSGAHIPFKVGWPWGLSGCCHVPSSLLLYGNEG